MSITLADDVSVGTGEGQLAYFAAMAREMFSQAKFDDTLDKVMDLAADTFRCDEVGFLILGEDDVITAGAASHIGAERADALQIDRHQGPGLQAITRRQPVIATELRFDSRWRFWAPLAADLGFRSVLSLSITDGDLSGALNLYSRQASCFQSESLALASVFAQHAAIAIAIAREREQLLLAVESHGLVGQAQGILMERYDITSDQAFTVLRRYSTHLNQKLRIIAERVIRDRNLPEVDAADEAPTLEASPAGPAAQRGDLSAT